MNEINNIYKHTEIFIFKSRIHIYIIIVNIFSLK